MTVIHADGFIKHDDAWQCNIMHYSGADDDDGEYDDGCDGF